MLCETALAADKVMVKVTLLPSAAELLLTAKLGAPSSLLMVPMPCESPIVAPAVAAERFSSTVSANSKALSSMVVTVTVLLVCADVKLRVPDLLV